MTEQVFIGLGSNVGEPKENIRQSIERLRDTGGVQVRRISSLYLTEPVGYEEQPWFYNCVVQIATELSPFELLTVLLNIENHLGRVRTLRWGPRTVDLDLLLYDDQIIHTDNLTVPHPRMLERAFVMVPLAEIAGDMILPNGEKVSEAADKIRDGKKCSYIQE